MGLVASLQYDELRKEALVKPQTVLRGLAGNGPEAVRSKAAIAAAVRKRQERPQRGSKKERALLAPSKTTGPRPGKGWGLPLLLRKALSRKRAEEGRRWFLRICRYTGDLVQRVVAS